MIAHNPDGFRKFPIELCDVSWYYYKRPGNLGENRIYRVYIEYLEEIFDYPKADVWDDRKKEDLL